MDWISKKDFKEIEVGDTHLKMIYMIGRTKVVKAPYTSKGNDCIKVIFLDPPWDKKGEIEIVRQSIKKL